MVPFFMASGMINVSIFIVVVNPYPKILFYWFLERMGGKGETEIQNY